MKPGFETITAKHFIGRRMQMSFATNKTGELWREFMPRLKEITNTIGTDLFSIEV